MEFFSIGSDILSYELFCQIKNSPGSKPYGGLWCTPINEDCKEYNSWVDFIVYDSNRAILFYKYHYDYSSPFIIPAVTIKLKKTASILNIETVEQLKYLMEKFPDNEGWIDFEKLSSCFDGVFLKIGHFLGENDLPKSIIRTYAVDTLCLFNLECIDNYQKSEVTIYQIYANGCDYLTYKVNYYGNDEISIIPNQKLSSLISQITSFIQDVGCDYTQKSETLITTHFKSEINDAIESLNSSKKIVLI